MYSFIAWFMTVAICAWIAYKSEGPRPHDAQDRGQQQTHVNERATIRGASTEQHSTSAQISNGSEDFDPEFHRLAMELLFRAASMDDDPTINPYLMALIWSPRVMDGNGEPQLYCIVSRLLREAFYQRGWEPATFARRLSQVVCDYQREDYPGTSSGTAVGVNHKKAMHRHTTNTTSHTSTRDPRKRFSEHAMKLVSAAKAMGNDSALDTFLCLFILRPETKHYRNSKSKIEVSPLLQKACAEQGVDIQEILAQLDTISRDHRIS